MLSEKCCEFGLGLNVLYTKHSTVMVMNRVLSVKWNDHKHLNYIPLAEYKN